MARNLLDDYMNQPKRQGNKNLLDEYIKMSTPKLDTTAYTNMLNTLLNSSAVTGNGYQTPAVMASAANTARKAQQIAEKYGIGDSSYRQYLDSVASGVQGKQQFMSQFTGKQDYNQRYAYPQTVKGKTDAEIEAMIGAVPKAQTVLNRAAAFGKGTGSSGDDAYQKWLTDYFNNQTVTGLDRQIADNQGLLDANKAKQEGLLASAYVPENVGMTATDRKIREDYIAQYPNQERQEMEWTEMATGLAGWEEQKQIIEEMIKELQESGSFDQEKMDELQDSWLDAERHIHNLEEQMDAYTAPDEAERLAGQETHTYVGATPEQERLDALYYQYLDELDKDNRLKYETGPEQWAYDRDMQLSGLTSEQEKLDAQNAVLNAKREEVVVRSKYNDLVSAPDFAAKSAYDSDNQDRLYQYINAKGTSQETGKKLMLGMENYGYDADEIRESVYSDYGYTFLLPEEVQAYNYIYKKEGREKAQEFLDSFQNIRNLRARSKESEEWAKYADEHGVWASVVSLGTNLASGLMYPLQAIDAKFNPDHSQFSPLYSSNYATQAIRGTVGQNVAEWAGNDLGNTVYQTLMSLGDFGVALAAGKGAGALAGSGFARGMTQFIMSSEAGSSALLNNLQRGLSTDRAVGMSVASAMIEALTEKYSIDALLKEPKKAALYIAKNMLTEGSEEAASNLANTLVDLIVNADQAELAQAIAEKGYAQALTEYAQSVGMDAIMGALSGGIMGGGSVAVNKGVQAYHTAQTGKHINTNQTYKQLHDIAVAMPEGSKARKIAQGNDKLNNRKAGQLYNALMEELDAKSQTSVRKSMVTDIKGRLQELGAQGDTTQVAEAIQKALMGEKLSARESDLIAQSKLAMQVQHELLDLEEGWADKAHETASKQRRETLTQMLDVERLASKGYKPAQDDAAAKAISKNASTTYANADQEKGLNTTAYTKEGTTVEIKRIEEQDGQAVYLVEKNGQDVTYAINDLELDSINTENLVQPLKRGKMSVQAANTMMQLYATSGLSAPLYAKGFTVAYNAGVQRIGMAYVNNNSYSKALSPEVRKAAFDAGMADTKDEAPSVTKRKGRVTVDKSIDKANLTDNQKASIRAMEKLAKALHIDIEFFASKADATGSYAAYENGSFRDGVMRLDINAGRDKSTDVTEFAILRTASHELTHYIAEASHQMYQELQAFVVDHLLEKGQSLQTLMDRKKARENRAMSDEAALEEVIADACEMMLKDSTAIETLARENATLFEKMADWLRDFFDKIREAFAGVEAVHAEARALMEADADGVMHYIDGLQALWDKALVDAARNVQMAEARAEDGDYRREKFSRRGGGLLNGEESKRLESNWNDYKYRGYQFTKRPNGGIMVSMGNLIVYTHPTGNPEHVIEIDDSENADYVEESNKIFDRMNQLEKDGVTHEIQRQALQSMVRSVGAHFRSRKSNYAATIDADGRRGRGERENRTGVGGEVSSGRKVSVKRSIFFPSRFNRLFDQYLAKTQNSKYDPANFNPGEFTTMRIGDDVLLLKRRTENDFGLSAHYGANLGSRLTNARFENKRFASRADALAWLNGLKNENGKPLLFKSNWEPTSKKMFSVREPVERAKDMIAMHNIGGDAMMQFIKNGRLYWPSVAVVNDKAKFDSFGEYSLLFAPWQFGEDWDDPESAPLTERFRMYGSDAYTPSLPQEVAAALQKGEDTFRSMYGEWGTDPASVDDYIETLYGSRFNHGFPGSVRANAAKRYSSIEAMKQDRGRLISDGPTHDTMSISKELDERRNDLILRIWDKTGGTYGGYSNFRYEKYAGFENDLLLTVLDTVEDGKYMEEYGQQLEVIIDFAKERGIKMDRPLAKELLQLFEDVANDMVGYFEIKFSRNVNGAMDSGYPQVIVAPDNLPDAVRKYAEEAGIGLYTYKAGDSNNRRDVVNEAAGLEGIKFQARDADTISSREALANALETAAKNDLERGLLADYKKIIQSLNEDQEKLAGHQKIIRELSFKKGGLSQQEKDELAMAKNRAEIVRNRLNRNDKKLLNLEATEALKAVVARERVVAERKIRDKKDKQLAEYRERTRDTLTRSALRDRIRHDVKALNRLLLNETDTKHVPEELKGAVAQFLTVFTQDTSVFDQKKLDDLRYAYGKISDRNAANEDLPDISAQYDWDIANMMDDLREILPGKRLSELTQEETRKIRDIVQHFKFIVKESSRLFFYDKSQNVAKAGQKFIEDTDQQKKYNGPDGAVANMLRGGMITPSYFFKKLGGVAKELFDDLKQGESTYGLRVAQARKFFDDVAEKYHYDDWRNVKDDVLTLNTQQGHEVVLTREQALGLYATWNRENSENGQNASHLSEGGFVYEEAMKKDKKTGKVEVDTSKPHKMTDKDMQQVANWLTDEQRAYADAMVEYMSKDMAKLGNEVSMKLFGIEKYGEEKYYPYQTSKNYRYTALGAAAATNDQRLKHSSFTHRVTQFANNPIIAADFTTVWANHVNHMLLYSSMCVPLENFNRVYNYKYTDEDGNHSVKQSLINAYGSSAQKYIEQLMHDLNGGVAVQSDGVMDQLTSKFKKNAVYASASVVVQQPSAMVRAMALVNPKYFASGVMKDGSWDELTRYSGVAVIKEMGGFDTSTGFGAQDWITGERRKTKLETFGKKADDIASLLPERADRLAWVAIWKAVKAEVADNTGLEGEELMQAAAKRFDEVIGYTQVYDSTLSKSQMMRNKHLNAVTAFMAEPTVTYNLLVDAFFNRGKADSVNPARAVAAFTATAIVNAMLKSLVTAARDDEEKNYLEKYAGEFVENVTSDLNPLNLIPYARDIVSIMQGYDVERADMSLISDLYKGVKRGVESAKDGDWYTMAKEFAGPISGLVGLPVKNVWRDIEAVFNTIHSIGTPMTPGGMKYSILEALPFYGSTPTDYYSRRLDAMLEGDASELESLTMHLETGLGKAAKTVKSKTKEELGKRYKAGKIGDAEATDILMDYFEMDADEAYWQLKECREKEAHKDEDDYSFSQTDDLKEALLSGKTAQIEAAKTELAGVGGYTDKEVVSKAKSAIKSLYVDGQITFDKAVEMLNEQTDEYLNEEKGSKKRERQKKIENDLYWLEQEWEYAKANKDNDDADTWNKYNDMHATIESGKGQRAAVKYLMDHGVTKSGIKSSIDSRWAERYKKLYQTDRRAAIQLQSQIIDALVAAGYNRGDMAAHIRKNWLK